MAVVIIPHGGENDEDRIIGPFADGETANHWAFVTLPVGTEWYWLPMEAPTKGETK